MTMIRTYRDFTFEQISKAYIYEPTTGKLFRRHRGGKIKEINPVREQKGGDCLAANQAKFGGYETTVPHIIWMLMTRRWIKSGHMVDHKNGDVSDNRWVNLREVTPSQNSRNKVVQGRWVNADEGMERGVYKNGRSYRVIIKVNGAMRYFGTYPTVKEANKVAGRVIRQLHGEFGYEASRKPGSKRRL
jgi:hypothetical protein